MSRHRRDNSKCPLNADAGEAGSGGLSCECKPIPAAECKHERFQAEVDVNRMEDSGRFMADVRIRCADCETPFRFLGLPFGVDMNGAAVSANGEEARLAIGTRETVAAIVDSGLLGGFSIRREGVST